MSKCCAASLTHPLLHILGISQGTPSQKPRTSTSPQPPVFCLPSRNFVDNFVDIRTTLRYIAHPALPPLDN
jgi:hypothetical protein